LSKEEYEEEKQGVQEAFYGEQAEYGLFCIAFSREQM